MPQITQQQQTALIQRICKNEHIPHTTAGVRDLINMSNGDVRFTLLALQSVVLAAGEVKSSSVGESSLGRKEVVNDLYDYWKLIFLCRRQNGRRTCDNGDNDDDDIVGNGLVLSNLPELFRHFYDVDPDRMIEGVLEYIPSIPTPDPTLQRYVNALHAVIEFTTMRNLAKKKYMIVNDGDKDDSQ